MAPANATHVVCYAPAITSNGSVWLGQNPLAFSVPIFTVQVVLVVLTTRIMVFLLLKPLHQPRVLAEIIVKALYLRDRNPNYTANGT